ncbi:hypothetical protein QU38_02040, partial [Staphylococcus aureus]
GAADRHENHRAERPRDKRECEDGERPERALQRIEKGEDQLREHQHRGNGIDEEIEELGGAADDHADRDFARTDAVAVAVQRTDIALGGKGGDGIAAHRVRTFLQHAPRERVS